MFQRKLLVEGQDELHVFSALFKFHDIEQVFEIENGMGIDRVLDSIPVRLKAASNLERLAVVVDADTDLSKRWNQLRSALQKAGESELPETPHANGTIVPMQDGRVFGVWVMPDNEIPGMLESFIAFLVPPDDEMMTHVDVFLANAQQVNERFPDSKRPKARIHAWLAVQKEPGKPLGQAVTAKYLDADSIVVHEFLAWIRKTLVE